VKNENVYFCRRHYSTV